jgi:Fe-Mn family superoxide dismutase
MKRVMIFAVLSIVLFAACNTATQETQDDVNAPAEEVNKTVYEPTAVEELDGWSFADLGFDYNALEPYMDEKTVYLHYEKHHKGYYNRMIKALRGTELTDIDLLTLLSNSENYDKGLINNAAQHYNHAFFWEGISAEKTALNDGNLKTAIVNNFGSMEAFMEEFNKAAKTQFGSGWAWLSVDEQGKLFVSATSNHLSPIMDIAEKKGTPILCLDVWEHAYYLKYQNKRGEFINQFWDIVDWNKVEERYNGLTNQ